MRALHAIRRSLVPLGLGLATTIGCYNSGQGADPEDKKAYYPTGIAISPSGKSLFLANSNFDLRYNAGTVQAYDLTAITAAAKACRGKPAAECTHDASAYVRATVRIGAFAADMTAIARRDAAGNAVPNAGRLLLPVRGDASLTAIDFDEGETGASITLRCATGAQPAFGSRCAPEWRLGNDRSKSSRQIVLEGEPFAVAATTHWPADPNEEPRRSGGLAAVVHQSSGNVSLFVNVATDAATPQGKLAFILGGLPGGGTGIAPLDIVRDGERFFPRFLVTNRTQSSVQVVQYFPDPVVERSGLVLTDSVPLTPQSSGVDTRGVVVDPPNPGEDRPIRVFLTSRAPASLVIGQIDPVTRKLSFEDNIGLPIGPARLTRANIDGKTRILAASFDARSIVVYDPDARRFSNVIRTQRGPYGIAVDPVSKLAFIANFTDSNIQVMDLDPGQAGKPNYESIIFSVGAPSGPTR